LPRQWKAVCKFPCPNNHWFSTTLDSPPPFQLIISRIEAIIMESEEVKENQRLMQVVFELQLVWPGAHPQTVGWPGLNAVLIILRHMASYNEGYTLAPAQWEKNPILKLAFEKVTESPSDSELALRAKLADMFKKEHGRLATFSELFESDLMIQTLFTWPRLLNIFETKTWEIYPGGPSHWTEGQEYSLLECAQNSIVQWNGQMALEDWFQHRFKPFSDPSEPTCKVLYLCARPRFLYIKYTQKDGQPEHRFASLQTLSLDLLYAFPDSDPQMSKLDYKVTHYKLIATVRLADDAFPTDHIRTYGSDGTYIQGISPPKHVQEGHENIVNNHWHVGDTEGTYILIYVFEDDPEPLDSQEDLELDQADPVDPSLLTPLGGVDQDYNFSLPPIPPQSDVPPETSPVIGKTPLPNVGESKEDKSSLPSSVATSTKTSDVATPDITTGGLKFKRHGPLLTGKNSEAKATVSKDQPVQSQTPPDPQHEGARSCRQPQVLATPLDRSQDQEALHSGHSRKETEEKTEELRLFSR
jgi:hypothetical protein